jgi:hypothetical protein
MPYREAATERRPKVYHRWARGSRDFVSKETEKTIGALLARGVPWEAIKLSEGFSGQEWSTTVYWLGLEGDYET